MEECSVFDQLDPETKNLYALKAVSVKLCEVSKALQQCQKITQQLAQAVDVVAKRCAILQVERITEQTETQQNGHPCE